MVKQGFGMPKQDQVRSKDCPKCGTKMEIHDCLSIRINHKVYGEKGRFWVCKNVKQRKKGIPEYDVVCDYRERV